MAEEENQIQEQAENLAKDNGDKDNGDQSQDSNGSDKGPFKVSLDINKAADQLAKLVEAAWALFVDAECGAVITVHNHTDYKWLWKWDFIEQGHHIAEVKDIPESSSIVFGIRNPKEGNWDGAIGGSSFRGKKDGEEDIHAFFGCHIPTSGGLYIQTAYIGEKKYTRNRWDTLDLIRNQTRKYSSKDSVHYRHRGIEVIGKRYKHLGDKFFSIDIELKPLDK